MKLIQVNEKTCTQCGICADVCPRAIIKARPDCYPEEISRAEDVCIKCGHCVSVCPQSSIIHKYLPLGACPSVSTEQAITAEQCEQMLRGRRSVREYQNKPVSRESVSRLISIARYAPSGHNHQEVEWLVIDNERDLAAIEDAGLAWLRWGAAHPEFGRKYPLLDLKRYLSFQEGKMTLFLHGAPALVVAHAIDEDRMAIGDSVIALSYFDIAASSHGLGCCWAGLVQVMARSFPPLQEILALPKGHSSMGCMTLGHPRYRYYRMPCRNEPRIIWR